MVENLNNFRTRAMLCITKICANYWNGAHPVTDHEIDIKFKKIAISQRPDFRRYAR